MSNPEPGTLLKDWLAPAPWDAASINAHLAASTPESIGLPVLLVAAVTLPAALTWRWLRGPASWPGALAIIAAGWLALDLPWQWELADRLTDTQTRFAAVPASERPARTEHATAFNAANSVSPIIEASPGRIFVASLDEGIGMLTAYYLYPLNPYWERSGPQLPAPANVRSGDYILALPPVTLRYDRGGRRLLDGDTHWPARLVAARPWGALFRAL